MTELTTEEKTIVDIYYEQTDDEGAATITEEIARVIMVDQDDNIIEELDSWATSVDETGEPVLDESGVPVTVEE